MSNRNAICAVIATREENDDFYGLQVWFSTGTRRGLSCSICDESAVVLEINELPYLKLEAMPLCLDTHSSLLKLCI